MKWGFGIFAASLLVPCVVFAGEVRREMRVSCQVVRSATSRTTMVTAVDGRDPRVLVTSRERERGPAVGWFVSRAGDTVLEGPWHEGSSAAPPGAGPTVVTIFPDGAPRRVVFPDAPAPRSLEAIHE